MVHQHAPINLSRVGVSLLRLASRHGADGTLEPDDKLPIGG